MLPLRLILDTNIVVSAALKPESIPRTVVLLASTKPARWYVSREILEEYDAVLARRELRISRANRRQLMQLICNRARADSSEISA